MPELITILLLAIAFLLVLGVGGAITCLFARGLEWIQEERDKRDE